MVVMICCKKNSKFNKIAIAFKKENTYRLHFWHLSEGNNEKSININNN